jgi:succinylglutamic semialdehyde dehydrogenase
MNPEAASWSNPAPYDLDYQLPEIHAGDPGMAVLSASRSALAWGNLPWQERAGHLRSLQSALREAAPRLSREITEETGKPITEAEGELAAVVAKIDWTIKDGEEVLPDREVKDGPHPALIRHAPLGPALVIAPFNFPLHLGHGATMAYLLAGNPVIFKPSPFAGRVAESYGDLLRAHLPEGVFQVVQGGAEVARSLAVAPQVRAVCFTGSVPAGRALAGLLASDFSKSLALELGGHNHSLVCADADLDAAADAIAQSIGLTAGQRCNATSQVDVEKSVADCFLGKLAAALEKFVPGNPFLPETRMGPLISEAAVDRYLRLTAAKDRDWILPGCAVSEVDGKRGCYVRPALSLARTLEERPGQGSCEEIFAPVAHAQVFEDLHDCIRRVNSSPYGLSASVFTRDRSLYDNVAGSLNVGNVYWNLPTTLSPSSLPFGGWQDSGNGKPGARGFIRHALREKSLQWPANSP